MVREGSRNVEAMGAEGGRDCDASELCAGGGGRWCAEAEEMRFLVVCSACVFDRGGKWNPAQGGLAS